MTYQKMKFLIFTFALIFSGFTSSHFNVWAGATKFINQLDRSDSPDDYQDPPNPYLPMSISQLHQQIREKNTQIQALWLEEIDLDVRLLDLLGREKRKATILRQVSPNRALQVGINTGQVIDLFRVTAAHDGSFVIEDCSKQRQYKRGACTPMTPVNKVWSIQDAGLIIHTNIQNEDIRVPYCKGKGGLREFLSRLSGKDSSEDLLRASEEEMSRLKTGESFLIATYTSTERKRKVRCPPLLWGWGGRQRPEIGEAESGVVGAIAWPVALPGLPMMTEEELRILLKNRLFELDRKIEQYITNNQVKRMELADDHKNQIHRTNEPAELKQGLPKITWGWDIVHVGSAE